MHVRVIHTKFQCGTLDLGTLGSGDLLCSATYTQA